MQSFELLSSPAAALWHPQLRKTCSKRANNHCVRAPEPLELISRQRPAVKRWSGQAAQSFEILCGPAATLGHPQLRQTWDASIRPHWAQAEGTQGAPRKMRRQGAATPEATHRVSVGGAPSVCLPRQPHTAPLKRLPPRLAMAAPIRRKAPREYSGKCGGRARQPRGPLTGCL